MKKLVHFVVVALFVTQSSMAMPAVHRAQAAALDMTSQFENATDEALAQAPAELASPTDAKWVQKLASRLEKSGMKRFMKHINRELDQQNLTDAQKDRARAEAEQQAVAAIPQILEKARNAKSPLALIHQLKEEMKQARQQAAGDSAAASTKISSLDRKPAQIVISLHSPLAALVVAVIALTLVLLAFQVFVAMLVFFAPAIVIGIVLVIVL